MMPKRTDSNQAEIVNARKSYFICRQCGIRVICKPSHLPKKTYCSKICMAQGYRRVMIGSSNPNFRDAGVKTCVRCGVSYKSYNNTRQFCSALCYRASPGFKAMLQSNREASRGKPRPNYFRPSKPLPLCSICSLRPVSNPKTKTCSKECKRIAIAAKWSMHPVSEVRKRICIQCSATYHSYNKGRLYCSYPCFVASGGPFRAGLRASQMKRIYGSKQDANHREIVDAMRAVGTAIYDLSQMGHGVPDGIAWTAQQWRFFEIKNPKTSYGRRGLNVVQRKWLSQWKGGPVYVLTSLDEALAFARGKLDGLNCITPEDCARELVRAG
jgi:hypothetical protein